MDLIDEVLLGVHSAMEPSSALAKPSSTTATEPSYALATETSSAPAIEPSYSPATGHTLVQATNIDTEDLGYPAQTTEPSFVLAREPSSALAREPSSALVTKPSSATATESSSEAENVVDFIGEVDLGVHSAMEPSSPLAKLSSATATEPSYTLASESSSAPAIKPSFSPAMFQTLKSKSCGVKLGRITK